MKWAYELHREFSKEEVQMASTYRNECSSFLVIKEMQIKTTDYISPQLEWQSMFKGHNINKCWQGCGKTGTFMHCWWECKLVQPLWKAVWTLLKKLKI
jgi:hypothetical protein